jgi:hypothetical protein
VTVAAGETIPVELTWRQRAMPISDLRLALRLVDAASFTWAQADDSLVADPGGATGSPPSPTSIGRHGLLVPTGTPPGDYLLLLNVYNARDPRSLVASGQGAPIGPGGVTLAKIRVSQPSQLIWTPGISGFQPVTATFPSGVGLLGYAGSDQVIAGESGYLTLFWRALANGPTVASLHFALTTSAGEIVEQRDLPFATTAYPPSRWKTGDVLREQYRLPISDRLAAGMYHVQVGPVGSAANGALSPMTLGSVQVQPGAPPEPASAPQHRLQYHLDGKIVLDGFDLAADRVAPGSNVDLTLHWGEVAPTDGDYTVFVHVLDTSEKVVAQHDQQPAEGKRPTSSWFPGDTILDRYHLTLPATLAPGDYAIEVGMYNPSNGERLAVSLGEKPAGDRIIVTKLLVGA